MVSVVTSAEEAEEIVKQWLSRKFERRLRKTRVTHISLSEALWNVEAEVEITSGLLSTTRQKVSLKVDSNSAKIVSYTETEIKD